MNEKQRKKARLWAKEHAMYVIDLVFSVDTEGYPPTLNEDINNPALWKAEHWSWFFINQL